MEIKSDLIFKGSTWNRVDQGYRKKFFDTQWGIFKTCLSIGILYDTQLEDEEVEIEEEGLNIPRTMFNRNNAEMQFFFQSAILTSRCVDLSEKDRLYLAFSDEIPEEELEGEDENMLKRGVSEKALNFNKIEFMKKFANYGAHKMEKCLSANDSETMESLMEFLNMSYKGETEELQALYKVETLIDDSLDLDDI